MTIKEVEERTGLARSNIRFYEKERLLQPSRNDKNGYRDYSEQDVEDIKKIAYLRTLDISVEDIRYIIAEKVSLMEVIKKQNEMLQKRIEGLSKAKIMCERMIVIRILLRPALYVKLASRNIYGNMYGELIAEYLSNYICFIALSAEVFSILFAYGLVNSILVVLAVNTAVLIGLLAAGMIKMGFVF